MSSTCQKTLAEDGSKSELDSQPILRPTTSFRITHSVVEMPPVAKDRLPSPAPSPEPLVMPEACMYGFAGEQARTLQSPLGWAYPILLTLYAGVGVKANYQLRRF
jgi:hypothetical protein